MRSRLILKALIYKALDQHRVRIANAASSLGLSCGAFHRRMEKQMIEA